MTLRHAGTRSFQLSSSLTVSILTALALVSLPPRPASAQPPSPLPITELAYSAKFLCGAGAVAGDPGTLPVEAIEQTVVEIHNPHSTPVTITIKWVQDYPSFLVAIPPYQVTLASNEALNLDCTDWALPGCPPVCGTSWRGFVEIRTPQQLKVVALYKELMGQEVILSASVAKHNCLPYFYTGSVRHSGAFLVGNTLASSGDHIRHETTITMTNMSNNPVNANVLFLSSAGVVHSMPMPIPVNGFRSVSDADLPAFVPRPFTGSVMVQYPDIGFGAQLACEEILQKHLIAGPGNRSIAMAVVEVQPIPLR